MTGPAPGPGSLWDTSSLMTLVCSRAGIRHVRTPGVLRAPGWASAIPGELRRLNQLCPPTEHAGPAHRLALAWLGVPVTELESEVDPIWDLRDRIAAGAGHPDEHLGEAQSIIIARRLGAVFISEDAGAREEARVEKVRALSIYGLLGIHLHRGIIDETSTRVIMTEIHAGGRGPQHRSLSLAHLAATGHIHIG